MNKVALQLIFSLANHRSSGFIVGAAYFVGCLSVAAFAVAGEDNPIIAMAVAADELLPNVSAGSSAENALRDLAGRSASLTELGHS